MNRDIIESGLKKHKFSSTIKNYDVCSFHDLMHKTQMIEKTLDTYQKKKFLKTERIAIVKYEWENSETLTNVISNVKNVEAMIPKRKDDATSWIDNIFLHYADRFHDRDIFRLMLFYRPVAR